MKKILSTMMAKKKFPPSPSPPEKSVNEDMDNWNVYITDGNSNCSNLGKEFGSFENVQCMLII